MDLLLYLCSSCNITIVEPRDLSHNGKLCTVNVIAGIDHSSYRFKTKNILRFVDSISILLVHQY